MKPVIGVLVSGGRQSDIVSVLCRAIRDAGKGLGCTVRLADVSYADPQKRVEESWRKACEFVSAGVSGVIMQPVQFAAEGVAMNRRIVRMFAREGIPLVLLDSDVYSENGDRLCDCVSTDNVAAGEALGRFLLEKKIRCVRFLTDMFRCTSIDDRIAGLKSVLGLKGDIVWYGDAADAETVSALLEDAPKVRAIACQNDLSAEKLVKTLEGLGRRVPKDVLVLGFDDVSNAADPPFPTVHQPCRDLGMLAVRTLLHRIEEPDFPVGALRIAGSVKLPGRAI